MPNINTWDDKISSWKCSNGKYAIVYKDINYAGLSYTTQCKELNSENPAWNDDISSIKIRSCDLQTSDSTGCIFYQDPEFGGNALKSNSSIGDLQLNDNQFSSLYCYPGWGALVFDGKNYLGDKLAIELGGCRVRLSEINWDDKISSFKVYRGAYCCFYTDKNYQGNYFCGAHDIAKLSIEFVNRITSWKCSGASAILYSQPGQQGEILTTSCDEQTSNAGHLNWNGRTQSLKIVNCSADPLSDRISFKGDIMNCSHDCGENIVLACLENSSC